LTEQAPFWLQKAQWLAGMSTAWRLFEQAEFICYVYIVMAAEPAFWNGSK